MLQTGTRTTAHMKQRRHTPEQIIRELTEGQKLLASWLGMRSYTPLQAESIIDAAIEVRFIWPEQLR
jgi:hypothetical protein